MKRIIATTALALMLSTSAYAAGHIKPLSSYEMEQTGDIYASNFIGMRIYATESEEFGSWNNETRVAAGAEKEWDDIGEVNDVILGRDGSVKAVVLGIGGFLGMGERDIAVTMDQIKMVQEEGDGDDFFLVIQSNKAMLEQAPEYKRTAKADMDENDDDTAEGDSASNTQMAASDNSENATTTETNASDADDADAEESNDNTAEQRMDASGRPMLTAPEVEREGYQRAEMAQLTTEMLTGARVYGSGDKDIGEIDRLLLTDDGKLDRAVIDVGGFLGIGEHPIAVTMDELNIQRNEDGDVRVYIDGTQAELEKQPAFKE